MGSLDMAAMAFGRRSRTGLVGRLAHGTLSRVGGRRAPSRKGGHRKKPRRGGKFPRAGHRRGVTLSNEFLKTVIMIELIKGLKT